MKDGLPQARAASRRPYVANQTPDGQAAGSRCGTSRNAAALQECGLSMHDDAERSTAVGCENAKQSRRFLTRSRVALLLLLLAVLFHAPALRLAASAMVVDEPGAAADAVVVVNGDRCVEVAADLVRQGRVRSVILIESYPRRLERYGILQLRVERTRSELLARGVPESAIVVLDGQTRDGWEAARRLGRWLDSNPDRRVTVLRERFQGRYQHRIIDAVLDESAAARVSYRGLRDRRFDETDWWQSRVGIKEFLGSALDLASAVMLGQRPPATDWWNPDDYERQLAATRSEAGHMERRK